MAEVKVEGEALKKLVKLGRKKRLSFAFCPGPKNDHVMVVDKRKKPEIIGKLAKKEGAGVKVAFGTFVLNQKTMELTCERVVPAMAKTLKKYLKTQKVMVNILVMDENGNVLESDIEELPDDPDMDADIADDDIDDDEDQDTAEAAQEDIPQEEDLPEAQGNAEELVARLKAVQPVLATAAGDAAEKLKKAMALAVANIKSAELEAADRTITALEAAAARLSGSAAQAVQDGKQTLQDQPDIRALAARAQALKGAIAELGEQAQDKLMAALANAAKMLKAADLEGADALLGRIEAAVNKAVDTAKAAAGAEAEKWIAVRDRLQPRVDQLMQEKRGDLAGINRFFNYAKEQAEAGVYDKALAAATRAAELIKAAGPAQTTSAAQEAQDAAPKNVVAYTRSRLAWVNTRTGLRKELEGLKAEIDKATAGIEGLEEVPQKSAVLFDYLEGIDTSLEDTLERLVETPDGDRRESLKKAAQKIIEEYQGVLDTDFFKAVDNNGFVKTNIRANALDSLQKVSAALSV